MSPGEGLVIWLAILGITFGSLSFFYARGLTNLYGDGLAHMEGARRIFDSLTPGYHEIGTVWLPLYHLLVAPLAASDHLWRTGLGGSLISTMALALAAWFVFRLALEMNRSKAAAVLALAVFLLCPSMLYQASMPLTESLTLLWYASTVYGLFCFQQTGRLRPLVAAALAALLGTLTRYDGWYLLPFAALFVFLVRFRDGGWPKSLRRTAVFAGIAGLGPLAWFLHNAYRYGNPLEFYNGPDSARAIYAQQVANTAFRYPTDGSLVLAARYYLADLVLVMGVWSLGLALLGVVAWTAGVGDRLRRSASWLLLVPVIFYIHTLAYGSAALYVPTLFPHTAYNLRYGLGMLPGVAVFASFLLGATLRQRRRIVILAGIGVLLAGQAAGMLVRGVWELPLVKESITNTPCRGARQRALIQQLRTHYDGQLILVAKGSWPCVMPELGIPFRHTISESNRQQWRQMRTEPDRLVKWIIRGEDDSVDHMMRAYPDAFGHFRVVAQMDFPHEGSLTIYRRP